MIAAPLRAYLLSLADLTAIVDARIYQSFAPQKAPYPFVILGKTADAHEVCLDGVCPAQGDATYEIHCRALDPETADAIALAIFGRKGSPRLDGFRGIMEGGGMKVSVVCRVTDVHDEAFPPVHGEETWLASVAITVAIQWEEVS